MDKKENENMEQWNDVKKGNSGTTIIIILLLIIILMLGGFIFLKKDELFSNKAPSEEQKEVTKQEEQEEQEEVTIQPLDLTKCLNCTNSDYIFTNATEESDGSRHFSLKNDNNNVTLSINWATFCQFSGASACSSDTITYEIRGISKNVKNTLVGGKGQDITSTTFYYLLEDGTVEYTKLFLLKEDSQGNKYYAINYSIDREHKDANGNPTDYFASQGAVSGVKNVVKLYNVSVSAGGSGFATTIGALADGSFYDLGIY